eukprot:6207703-Pleurochrysis_carterae.AAC.1
MELSTCHTGAIKLGDSRSAHSTINPSRPVTARGTGWPDAPLRREWVRELEAIGNHLPIGSKDLDACGLQAKPGCRPFRCPWAYNRGGGRTQCYPHPGTGRQARPPLRPSVRPTWASQPS